jgi:hypothetical protein
MQIACGMTKSVSPDGRFAGVPAMPGICRPGRIMTCWKWRRGRSNFA